MLFCISDAFAYLILFFLNKFEYERFITNKQDRKT